MDQYHQQPPVPPADPSGNPYGQNPYNQGYNPYQQQVPMAPVITVKEWMLTMLVMIIPIVNIIMMFVWAFGDGNPSKQNYFKASLLWAAIIIGIYILIAVVFVGLIASLASF